MIMGMMELGRNPKNSLRLPTPPPPPKKKGNGLKINPPPARAKHNNNATQSTYAGTFRLSNQPREYLPNFPTPPKISESKNSSLKISSDSSRQLKSRVTSPALPSPSRVLDFATVLCVSAVFKIRNRNPLFFCIYLRP